MTRYLYAAVTLGLVSVAIPLRAGNRPHAGTDSQGKVLWTNDDLDKFHDLGLISIVGPRNEEAQKSASQPQPHMNTEDPEWYAEQAARLRDELERRRAEFDGYRQAIEDARDLKTTMGGINLDDGDTGITPEAGIEILQERVNETQADLDALEELARSNDIEPGTLRGE